MSTYNIHFQGEVSIIRLTPLLSGTIVVYRFFFLFFHVVECSTEAIPMQACNVFHKQKKRKREKYLFLA